MNGMVMFQRNVKLPEGKQQNGISIDNAIQKFGIESRQKEVSQAKIMRQALWILSNLLATLQRDSYNILHCNYPRIFLVYLPNIVYCAGVQVV